MNVQYALAVLQIAELQESELSAVGEQIHKTLKKEFPHNSEFISNDVSINVSADGKVEAGVKVIPAYHRADAKREKALFVTKDQIGYHSKIFTSLEDFAEESVSVFKSIVKAVGIDFTGKLSTRVICNFKLLPDPSNIDNPFEGFYADRFLGDGFDGFQKRGATSYISNAINYDLNIRGRIAVSAEINAPILPVELMEVGVRVLNITDQQSSYARIDLDDVWNFQGNLSSFDDTVIKAKLLNLHGMISTTYRQLQQEG